jgi:hypothetical protein
MNPEQGGVVMDSAEAAGDTYAVRDAEAAALTRAATDERQHRASDARRHADAGFLDALRRKQAAEELAIRQAQQRSEADTAAESAAAERAHAERMQELAARSRVDAEARALADAKRHEFAAAELAKATRARLAREQEAESLARQRAESERGAAELLTERIRGEQALEARVLARVAAERDAALQAARRQEKDEELADAARARVRAEQELAQQEAASHSAEAGTRITNRQSDADQPALVAPAAPAKADVAHGARLAPASRFGWRAGLLLCLGIALGGATGYLVAARGDRAPSSAVPDVWQLKLDRELPVRTTAR